MTTVPKTIEFVAVMCESHPEEVNGTVLQESKRELIDMFAFVPPKQAPIDQRNLLPTPPRLNVVILGLDAVSHMNFLRTMSQSYLYLTETLSAIGMQGYVSVGSSTFYNLIPLLSGLSVGELRPTCWISRHQYFDSCPLIWKNFNMAGYLTSFAEDAPSMGMFNYGKGGFKQAPVDYYLYPFTKLQEEKIGNRAGQNSKICYGPRVAFSVLLNYMKKLAVGIPKDQNYFQLTWATSLFHDFLNFPVFGDRLLLSTLKWFHRNEHLDNTVLILMSDHGMRFGKIRRTDQVS